MFLRSQVTITVSVYFSGHIQGWPSKRSEMWEGLGGKLKFRWRPKKTANLVES